MDVSIIIPVYNVENYIQRNIDSMLIQKSPMVEFIYVDDGSPDNSVELIQKAQKIDSRIKLIRQENQGLSGARNTGLRYARGKYIMFVDSDDFITSDATDVIPKYMEKYNLDILEAGEYNIYEHEAFIEHSNTDIMLEIFKGMDYLSSGKMKCVGCLFTYRRQFLQVHELRFAEGLLREDMDYLPRAIFYADVVGKTSYRFYGHVHRSKSITTTPSLKRSQDLVKIADRLVDFGYLNAIDSVAWNNYVRDCYMQAIHDGIRNGFRITDILEKKDDRRRISKYLLAGSKKHRVVGMVLQLQIDGMYSLIYRIKTRSL